MRSVQRFFSYRRAKAAGGTTAAAGSMAGGSEPSSSKAATGRNLVSAASSAARTPPPPPPSQAAVKQKQQQQQPTTKTLLLEGDTFCVSSDGVARTFYELVPSGDPGDKMPPIAIEELYDVKAAHKTFHLRQEVPGQHGHGHDQQHHHIGGGLHLPHLLHGHNQHHHPTSSAAERKGGKAPLGPKLASLELQEISHGVDERGCGTGSMTWESSIAMALYFSAHPEQVKGNVLELGSGVGLGGILSNLGPRLNEEYAVGSVGSITLTDANDEVLRQCKQNVQQAFGMMPANPAVNVSKLDWNEFGEPTNSFGCYHERYRTVIACDCAYKIDDVPSLGNALKALVHEDPESKVHLFGPNNRAAFQEVVRHMIDVLDMDVRIELVEVNRFRLKPGATSHWSWHHRLHHHHHHHHQRYATEEECAYARKSVSTFMHVIASHKPKGSKRIQEDMSGLD